MTRPGKGSGARQQSVRQEAVGALHTTASSRSGRTKTTNASGRSSQTRAVGAADQIETTVSSWRHLPALSLWEKQEKDVPVLVVAAPPPLDRPLALLPSTHTSSSLPPCWPYHISSPLPLYWPCPHAAHLPRHMHEVMGQAASRPRLACAAARALHGTACGLRPAAEASAAPSTSHRNCGETGRVGSGGNAL
eukprot:364993-Chlamydomonas_euryale.AAC.3